MCSVLTALYQLLDSILTSQQIGEDLEFPLRFVSFLHSVHSISFSNLSFRFASLSTPLGNPPRRNEAKDFQMKSFSRDPTKPIDISKSTAHENTTKLKKKTRKICNGILFTHNT